MHRNSQKRLSIRDGTYFITTNTKDRFPYFENDIFSDLLVLHLELCKFLYGVDIYAYKINPEHIHILIGVGEDTGLSKVMNVLKGNFSRDANRMMNHIEGELHIEGDPPEGRLQTMGRIQRDKIHDQFHIRIRDEINTFIFKCDHESFANIPKFQWHKSFHDHYIRDERDFYHHIQYIQNQWIKHSLKENKYCYIMEDIL